MSKLKDMWHLQARSGQWAKCVNASINTLREADFLFVVPYLGVGLGTFKLMEARTKIWV